MAAARSLLVLAGRVNGTPWPEDDRVRSEATTVFASTGALLRRLKRRLDESQLRAAPACVIWRVRQADACLGRCQAPWRSA